MRRVLFKIAALVAAALAAGVASAEEEMLYWMVDGTAQVTLGDGSVVTISSFLPEDTEDSWTAARIRVTGGDIDGETILPLYDVDNRVTVPGNTGMAFDSNAGYWGAGVPTGNKSPTGAYSAGDPEYSFIVELGNVAWNESSGSASWVSTLAESAAVGYSDLYQSGFIHTTFDLNPPMERIWMPTSFSEVPEPSSGILLLMGGALLALRRRTCGKR